MWIDPDELLSDFEPSRPGGGRRDSPEDLETAFRTIQTSNRSGKRVPICGRR